MIPQRQAVGTDGVKGDIAEVQQPRKPDHNVQPEAEQDVDQAEDRDRQHVLGGDERKTDCQGDNQRQDPAHPTFVFRRTDVNPGVIVVETGHHTAARGGR